VTERLTDASLLRKGRVHPVRMLIAAKVYATGRSEKGTTTWTPVPQVTGALSDGFYAAFRTTEPAGKRTMIALDISGSMTYSAAGYGLTAREAVAAMSLVVMNTEPAWGCYGFSDWFMPLQLSPQMRLDQAMGYMAALPFGATDCSLPMVWAATNKIEVDTFQIWSDYEANRGIHVFQALENYRQRMGINARMQTIMTTPTRFALADPDDAGSLDVSGFDADVPALLADHARGSI
jgi:60 kDa SS-A/Ro ribonucleoprotein